MRVRVIVNFYCHQTLYKFEANKICGKDHTVSDGSIKLWLPVLELYVESIYEQTWRSSTWYESFASCSIRATLVNLLSGHNLQ